MTAAPGNPAKARVVLVDDTEDYRLLVRLALETYGDFDVVGEAGDGRAGIEAVRQHQPDVVLLDLSMPLMDGLQALPGVKEACPEAQVIVLSGFEGSRMERAALEAGATAYLQKGARPTQIAGAVSEALGHSIDERAAVPPAQVSPEDPVQSELERLRDQLATTAHELRSPTTLLMGLAQTLGSGRDSLGQGTVDRLLDAIVRQARLLDRVTSDLLTASQADRGAVAVDPQPLRLAPALDAAAIAVSQRDDVHVHCPADLVVVADGVRLEQVLGNLLSNAFKYGAPPVSVTAQRNGSEAQIRVGDCGPGVPEELLGRLFQQYARAEGLRASGNGLGLYVVRSLAEAQGGRAWYEFSADGGPAFCVALPLAQAEEAHVD